MDKITMTLFEKNTVGKVLYVRHGQTEFNYQMKIIGEDNVQTIPALIDSCLSPQGLESIKGAIDAISSLTFEAVYCSPLKRTLQTAFYLIENHPQREATVVYVHPLITEKVNGVHDYSFDIIKKKSEYNMESKVKFNWDIFDSYYKDTIDQELFMFNNCPKDINEMNALIKKIRKSYLKGDKEQMRIAYGKMGGYLINNHLKTFESFENTFKRNICFKQYLLKKMTSDGSYEKKNDKILVVTHSAFTKMATSSKAYNSIGNMSTYPEDCYHCANGEIISMNITEEICLNNKEFEL